MLGDSTFLETETQMSQEAHTTTWSDPRDQLLLAESECCHSLCELLSTSELHRKDSAKNRQAT